MVLQLHKENDKEYVNNTIRCSVVSQSPTIESVDRSLICKDSIINYYAVCADTKNAGYKPTGKASNEGTFMINSPRQYVVIAEIKIETRTKTLDSQSAKITIFEERAMYLLG